MFPRSQSITQTPKPLEPKRGFSDSGSPLEQTPLPAPKTHRIPHLLPDRQHPEPPDLGETHKRKPVPGMHPCIPSPEPSQRAPLAGIRHGTPALQGEDGRIEEREGRSRERDEGESLASAGSRGEAAAGYSMERTLADGALDGDKGVGGRRERVEVGGAEVGDERAEVIDGGDVRRVVMVPPFEMGELEYLRHIPSFRTEKKERGVMTPFKAEDPAWEEGGQATAGKSEADGGCDPRGLRVAWWKTGFAVRGIPSLGEEVAEKEQGRKGGLGSGRVMRRCVSACDF